MRLNFRRWLVESNMVRPEEEDAFVRGIYDLPGRFDQGPGEDVPWNPDDAATAGVFADYLDDQGVGPEDHRHGALSQLLRWRQASQEEHAGFCKVAKSAGLTPTLAYRTLRNFLASLKDTVRIDEPDEVVAARGGRPPTDEDRASVARHGIYGGIGVERGRGSSMVRGWHRNPESRTGWSEFDIRFNKAGDAPPRVTFSDVILSSTGHRTGRGVLAGIMHEVRLAGYAYWAYIQITDALMRCGGDALQSDKSHFGDPAAARHSVSIVYRNGRWDLSRAGLHQSNQWNNLGRAIYASLAEPNTHAAAVAQFSPSHSDLEFWSWWGIMKLPEDFDEVVRAARLTRADERNWVYREFHYNAQPGWAAKRGEMHLGSSMFQRDAGVMRRVLNKILAAYGGGSVDTLNPAKMSEADRARIVDALVG